MSFATATIQGYVTWIGDLQQTPSGRNVVNMLVSVPDRKKESSTTYKLSVWDAQTGNVLKYIKVKQLITAQGAVSLENYVGKGGTILRLDFANILDYGAPVNEEGKVGFVPVNLSNMKSAVTQTKERVMSKSK